VTKRLKPSHYNEEYKKMNEKLTRDSPANELLLFLAKTKVDDIPLGRSQIISVHKTEKIPSAFKKLIDHRILAVPVVKQDGTFYGFLDILDIVTWLVNFIGEGVLNREDLSLDTIDAFQQAEVMQVMTYPMSKKQPFHPIKKGSSLLSAVELLADEAHRIAIVDEHGIVCNILTQTSVLNFINDHINMLGDAKNMMIFEMEASTQYVLSVSKDQRAIDAFRLMRTTDINGLAVKEDHGYLVGNISARDLQRIANDARFVYRLFQDVSQFIKNEPICVQREDTLQVTIRNILNHKIHRVYVVESTKNMKPVGVISITDILKQILP